MTIIIVESVRNETYVVKLPATDRRKRGEVLPGQAQRRKMANTHGRAPASESNRRGLEPITEPALAVFPISWWLLGAMLLKRVR